MRKVDTEIVSTWLIVTELIIITGVGFVPGTPFLYVLLVNTVL